MLRLSAIVLSLVLATVAGASAPDAQFRETDPMLREGRAVVVHPAAPLTALDRAVLAQEGVFVKHALVGGRYLARVADGVTVDDPRVVSIEPLTPRMKIHASALHAAALARPFMDVHVIFQQDVTFDSARSAILAAGGAMRRPLALTFSPSQRIDARIAPASLEALAADDRVLAIAGDRPWRVKADNATSAALSHVTELQAAPYNLTGAGVTVSLFELAAAQGTHVEFGGRMTVNTTGGSSGDATHATHVAGTIGASGVRAEAKGMAPAVSIQQFCINTPCGTGELSFLDEKDEKLQPLGVVADNNSWGFVLGWSTEGAYPVWNDADEYYGAYDLIVGAPLDQISNEKHVLFVHSAGNDGGGAPFNENGTAEHRHVDDQGNTIEDKVFCYSQNGSGTDCAVTCTGGCETVKHHTIAPFDTMGVTASAKNVVSVGAVSGAPGLAISIVPFSSRGPAKDGRVKPDVVARGAGVFSSVPTNTYARLSGTSMASPAVTGISALITEQWRKTFAGASPLPSQIKALLIAGAEDLGNPGPDYTYGFGLVNAKNSVDAILADGGQGKRIFNLTLAQGGTNETSMVVTKQENVRVVLNWPDPPIAWLGGSDIAEKALVNDLDLKVIDPSGVTHLPYVLNKDSADAPATNGVNNVDNVEMVEIANALPGTYRVIVTGSAVTEGPQAAVLVTSASAGVAPPPCVDIQETTRTNDTATTATGDLVTGQTVTGAICTQSDVDFFKFSVTKSGPVSVVFTASDTPLRVTLTGTGVNATVDVPANATRTLSANVGAVPNALMLKVEANGTLGSVPRYSFVPSFGVNNLPRRRSARR